MAKSSNLVGASIRRVRTQKKLSQQMLAERLQISGWDVSRDIIARIEGRVRAVSDYELLIISRTLDTDLAALIDSGISDEDLGLMCGAVKKSRPGPKLGADGKRVLNARHSIGVSKKRKSR